MARANRLAALTEMFRVSHNVPSTPLRSLSGEIRERTIWGYWAQGAEQMPVFFQLCVDTWRHHNPNWDVRVLNLDNVGEFLSEAELPNRFTQMFSHQTASDAVRLALLSRYGGVWLDVNVLLRTSLDKLCWDDISSGESSAAAFFHPSYGTKELGGEDFVESWFLATRANNPFFMRWRDLFRELFYNRLDVKALCEHPLYQGLNLSGFDRLNREFQASFDFKEYLAIHVMCHRLLETDTDAREQWQRSRRFNTNDSAFRVQLEAERQGTNIGMVFVGGDKSWDAVANVPLIKFTTPHYSQLVALPREVLTDERGLIGRIFRASGVR